MSKGLLLSLICLLVLQVPPQKSEAAVSLVDLVTENGGLFSSNNNTGEHAFPELAPEVAAYLGLTEQEWTEYNSQRTALFDFFGELVTEANSVFGISKERRQELESLYQIEFKAGTRRAIAIMLERELN